MVYQDQDHQLYVLKSVIKQAALSPSPSALRQIKESRLIKPSKSKKKIFQGKAAQFGPGTGVLAGGLWPTTPQPRSPKPGWGLPLTILPPLAGHYQPNPTKSNHSHPVAPRSPHHPGLLSSA